MDMLCLRHTAEPDSQLQVRVTFTLMVTAYFHLAALGLDAHSTPPIPADVLRRLQPGIECVQVALLFPRTATAGHNASLWTCRCALCTSSF